MTADRDRRYYTAIHEAGHFVAHCRLTDRDYGNVTIKPTEDCAGSAWLEDPWGGANDFRAEVVVLTAGYAAAVLYGEHTERARAGASSDFEKAEEIIAAWNFEPIGSHIETATELLARPENRRAIERIADELLRLETLPGEEADLLIDVCDGECSETDFQRFRDLRAIRGKLKT